MDGGGLKYSLNSRKKRIFTLSLALCVTLVGGLLAYADIKSEDPNNFIFAGTTADSAIIPRDGTYLIEVSGGTSSDLPIGGRLSCYMELNAGDVITSDIYPGGNGGKSLNATGAKGGDAVAINVNAERVIGAGGAGGTSVKRYDAGFLVGEARPVAGIDNNKFGSGGGGCGDNYSGSAGQPSGSIGGYMSFGVPVAGEPGANYLDTYRATLIEQSNKSAYLYYRVVEYTDKKLMLDHKILGNNLYNSESLTIIGNSISSTDDAVLLEAVLPLATYTITLKGGRSGGCVTSDVMLKKGDKLLAYQIGGVGAVSLEGNIPGGNLICVDLIDSLTKERTLIAGAGGGSYNGTGGQSTLYYDNGVYGETVGTAGYIGLSSGASSNHASDYVPGTDILKGVWGTGAPNGQGSANYIDREFFSTYTSTANAGTGQIQGSITITLKSIATKDQITVVELQRDIAEIKASLSAIKVPESAPVITVVDGQVFEMRLNQYDDMDPAVQDGISIVNQAKDDGFIQISGQLSGKGYKDIVIGGKKFTFNVIEAPTAANVTVTFD